MFLKIISLVLINSILCFANSQLSWHLPINTINNSSIDEIQLTKIGSFGEVRKARPKVKEHLHTGIDIKRPSENYDDEPVFSSSSGKVISMRDDGPFAQIIIEHYNSDEEVIWTVYEHISGIQVNVNDEVYANQQIARFMNREELNNYGWQFDHIHFEVMKIKPIPVNPDDKRPSRYFATYCLLCFDYSQLEDRYYNPLDFLAEKLY